MSHKYYLAPILVTNNEIGWNENLLVDNMFTCITNSSCDAQAALESWTLESLEGYLKNGVEKSLKRIPPSLSAVPSCGT